MSNFIDFRGSVLTVITLVIKSANIQKIDFSLSRHLAKNPDFFSKEPIVIDVCHIDDSEDINWPAILRLLYAHGLKPFAVKTTHAKHISGALHSGLSLIEDNLSTKEPSKKKTDNAVKDQPRTTEEAQPSLLIERPVRSGQQVYSKTDIILMNVAGHGSELISEGNIHVYAPLRGRALAGSRGNKSSKIFTTCFEAELVAIAGVYLNFADGIPKQWLSQPVIVSLREKSNGDQEVQVEILAN